MDIKRLFIEQASANINTYNNSNSQHSSSNAQLIGTLNHPIKNRKIEGIKKMPSISEGVFYRQALEN
jgi:hypothetical protein